MYSRKGHVNYDQYRTVIHYQHKTRIVRTYFSLYAWFWYHTEFWIKDKEQRRPYTYIMRDWIYPHMSWFVVILVGWYAGMLAWSLLAHSLPNEVSCLVLSTFSSWLSAHLIWGSKWKQGEQEWPPVIEHKIASAHTDNWTESGRPVIFHEDRDL